MLKGKHATRRRPLQWAEIGDLVVRKWISAERRLKPMDGRQPNQ